MKSCRGFAINGKSITGLIRRLSPENLLKNMGRRAGKKRPSRRWHHGCKVDGSPWKKTESTRVAIQGFGNVGSHAAKFLSEATFPIVAVSDVTAAYYDPKGLNIGEIFRYVLSNKGSLHGYSGAKKIPSDELLNLDVDLLIPAALGDVITQANAATVKAKIIIEAANGPISPRRTAISKRLES